MLDNSIAQQLMEQGFAVTPPLLDNQTCADLRDGFGQDTNYRSTIDMQRYNFGRGTYRYFQYPLPPFLQKLREDLYAQLVPAANQWSERTGSGFVYPADFSTFSTQMRERGQTKSTPLILKYGAGDYNCLHQDIANDLIFPYQIVFGLSRPGEDYAGGHFILTQQRPRMQTVPHVLTLPQGTAVIFTSNYHPQQGSRGYYRTIFKHGVSRVESGERFTLGLVFHDYRD